MLPDRVEIYSVVESVGEVSLEEDMGREEWDGVFLAVVPLGSNLKGAERARLAHNPWEGIDLGFEIEVRV